MNGGKGDGFGGWLHDFTERILASGMLGLCLLLCVNDGWNVSLRWLCV